MRRTRNSMVATLLGAIVCATSVLAEGNVHSPQGEFQPWPAGKEPPENVSQQQEEGVTSRGLESGRLTGPQLRQMLLSHPKASIRAKAQQAAKRTPGEPWLSKPKPPDPTVAKQTPVGVDQGHLSKDQLRQFLLTHPKHSIRAKALEAQRVKTQQHGSLDPWQMFSPLSGLWASLNPFAPLEVQAQSTLAATPIPETDKPGFRVPGVMPQPFFSVSLTPQAPNSATPSANLELNGVKVVGATNQGGLKYFLWHTSSSGLDASSIAPYARVTVTVPRTGWYLIDFYGHGHHIKTRIRKYVNGQYPTLESWDLQPGPGYNHFATAELLEQGWHSFQLQVTQNSVELYQVLIEEF